MKVFIFHGICGSPGENWFPWMKAELERFGCRVSVPQFPTPKNQNLSSWLNAIKDHEIDENSILIGHSLGCAFILNILETAKVKAAFMVAGFCTKLNNEFYDSLNKTFIKNFDWTKIKNNCGKFFIYHSDNDPHVPLSYARDLAKKLDAKSIIIRSAGHFNTASGYNQFDFLLNNVKSTIAKDL